MTTTKFTGTLTALVTPMANGKVAWDDLERLTEHQIKEGIDGLVAVGTTGESPTLSTSEHLDVIRFMVEKSAERVPVLAGTGSNSTDEAISLTKAADQAGADGFLVVGPYYNKPSPAGMLAHFSALAEVSEKPFVLYSIPSRCGVAIEVETVSRLREKYPHVNHIKEAGGTCARVDELRQNLGDDMTILSGDDALTLPFLSLGAEGVISVASNILVKPLVEMVKLARANDFHAARKIHESYLPLFQALFMESNPGPVKAAARMLGLISSSEIRLPLAPVSQETEDYLENLLRELNLLS
ncbi:MAG: 4-hydroxy-tetrahydrodipicolinate synthase [Opitutales bacterium]|nr:4-hydroxy-tetrahydrodipicolinate synthase [Opitutales bacterium]MCH8539566.1 4-hydroxy-tetrahydrodipicolinate synthase [Opitutales bacterium]